VNIQFIVNGYGAQSVSITPERGAIPSFGQFTGPLHHEVVARFGAEQTSDVKRQDAVHEMAERGDRGPGFGVDLNRLEPSSSVPGRSESGWTQDFPAKGVGDVERQTSISKSLISSVHPSALHTRWANIDVPAVVNISD
jgi:hypothetical protein